MWTKRLMSIAWPAFLVAAVLEMTVFALVDPGDLHWHGAPVQLSREAVYTMTFFLFWIAAMASSALTVLLAMSSTEINQGVGPTLPRHTDTLER
jgi:energy-coupling factor transporter transmembrane protein EcfT